MSIGKDLLGSVLGLTETAYLVVLDQRKLLVSPDSDLPGADGPLGVLDKVRAQANKVSTAVAGAITALTNDKTKRAGGISHYEGAVSKYFQVQFNPSEMTVNTADYVYGEISAQTTAAGGSHDTGTTNGSGGSSTLSVVLYFDDMNKSDAFTSEKFTPSAAGALTTAGKLFGAEWSVQPQVEALVAALRNPATRQLSFYWADFAFTGTLNFVSAEYTMFSITGQPIRAKVSLRIDQKMETFLMADWDREFKKAFATNSSMEKAGQKVGSVLGLNL